MKLFENRFIEERTIFNLNYTRSYVCIACERIVFQICNENIRKKKKIIKFIINWINISTRDCTFLKTSKWKYHPSVIPTFFFFFVVVAWELFVYWHIRRVLNVASKGIKNFKNDQYTIFFLCLPFDQSFIFLINFFCFFYDSINNLYTLFWEHFFFLTNLRHGVVDLTY